MSDETPPMKQIKNHKQPHLVIVEQDEEKVIRYLYAL